MNDEQLLRYSRHLLLEQMGIEAQERLLASTVLVLGAGGLGCPAATYLASAGVGHLLIVDDDVVDRTNLQRQTLHREDRIGQPKALSAQRSLRELNAGCEVEAIVQRLDEADMRALSDRADVVLDCSDNFATRHALNRACVATHTPLVSGSAIRFDGQVSVFDVRDPMSPCYYCLFPEAEDVEEVRCATMGVFAPLTGVVGTLQAAEALKIAGGFGQPAVGRLLLYDALSTQWRAIRIPRDTDCPVCSARASTAPTLEGDSAAPAAA